jgi:purine-binding chemotaxis protein CheW
MESFLSFSVNSEKFALPLLAIKEVIGNTATTPIPECPPYFKGIINLRGQVISIVDLRLKLNGNKSSTPAGSTIIILHMPDVSLGIIVDSVDSVISVNASEISPPPDVQNAKTEFITGVARRGNELVLILDMKYLINPADREKIQAQKAA